MNGADEWRPGDHRRHAVRTFRARRAANAHPNGTERHGRRSRNPTGTSWGDWRFDSGPNRGVGYGAEVAEMSTNQHSGAHRAAIYASTSSRSTAFIRGQLDVARSHAERIRLEVVREYVDLRGNNAELLRMMADATADDPPFRKALVSDFSRVSRRVDELNGHRERLAAHGVELISVTVSEAGIAVSGIGEYLTSEHSEPVRRGMRAAARRGFDVFANAPYGYHKVGTWDRGVRRFKLEPDPPASETVRMIFNRHLSGASLLEIAAELNAIGARSPTVGRWRARHVSRILSNEVYCGASVTASQDMQDPDTAVRAPNAFPAIVSQEEFDRVQRMRGTVSSGPSVLCARKQVRPGTISSNMIGGLSWSEQ